MFQPKPISSERALHSETRGILLRLPSLTFGSGGGPGMWCPFRARNVGDRYPRATPDVRVAHIWLCPGLTCGGPFGAKNRMTEPAREPGVDHIAIGNRNAKDRFCSFQVSGRTATMSGNELFARSHQRSTDADNAGCGRSFVVQALLAPKGQSHHSPGQSKAAEPRSVVLGR